MNVQGVWISAVSGRKVMHVTRQGGACFAGHYYTSKGSVPDNVAFPMIGHVTQIGGSIRRIAWTVCWDFLSADDAGRSYFSSVAGWAGSVHPAEGSRPRKIDAMWLLSSDPSSGFRVGDDKEWGSISVGGDAQLWHSDEPATPTIIPPLDVLKSPDVAGTWENELGSILTVKQQSGSYFSGEYQTAVGNVAERGPYAVEGQITQLGHPAYARLAFTVCYDDAQVDPNRSSVALFCGKLASPAVDPQGRARIDALWIVSHDPSPPCPGEKADPNPNAGEWKTKSLGRNEFFRKP